MTQQRDFTTKKLKEMILKSQNDQDDYIDSLRIDQMNAKEINKLEVNTCKLLNLNLNANKSRFKEQILAAIKARQSQLEKQAKKKQNSMYSKKEYISQIGKILFWFFALVFSGYLTFFKTSYTSTGSKIQPDVKDIALGIVSYLVLGGVAFAYYKFGIEPLKQKE